MSSLYPYPRELATNALLELKLREQELPDELPVNYTQDEIERVLQNKRDLDAKLAEEAIAKNVNRIIEGKSTLEKIRQFSSLFPTITNSTPENRDSFVIGRLQSRGREHSWYSYDHIFYDQSDTLYFTPSEHWPKTVAKALAAKEARQKFSMKKYVIGRGIGFASILLVGVVLNLGWLSIAVPMLYLWGSIDMYKTLRPKVRIWVHRIDEYLDRDDLALNEHGELDTILNHIDSAYHILDEKFKEIQREQLYKL